MELKRWACEHARILSAGAVTGLVLILTAAATAHANLLVGATLLMPLAVLGLAAGLMLGQVGPSKRSGKRIQAQVWLPAQQALGIVLMLPGFASSPAGSALTLVIQGATALGAAIFLAAIGELLARGLARISLADAQPLGGVLAPFLGGVAVGALAATGLLPWIGPHLLLAVTALVAIATHGARRRVIIVMLSMIAALAVLSTFQPGASISFGSPSGPGAQLPWRLFFSDGEASVVRHGGTRTTSISGGALRWVSALGKRHAFHRLAPASALMAAKLTGKGRILLLGPASAANMAGYVPLGTRRKITVWGDGRMAALGNDASRVGAGLGIRAFLARNRERFDVIYFADPNDDAAIASGLTSARPALHLTTEALAAMIATLKPEGYLVLEVPYGLKAIGVLKELEHRQGFKLTEQMVVYGTRGEQSARDVVIFSPTNIRHPMVLNLTRLAALRERWILFDPRANPGPRNGYIRLAEAPWQKSYSSARSEDFSAPTDDRPFFHHIAKFVARSRSGDRTGLHPFQDRRYLGVFTPIILPWSLFTLLAGVLFLGSLGRRPDRSRWPHSPWRSRMIFSHLFLGASAAVATETALLLAARAWLVVPWGLPAGIVVAALGISIGLIVPIPEPPPGRFIARRAIWALLLPGLLPLVVSLLPAAWWTPQIMTLALLTALPFLACLGWTLRRTLTLGAAQGMSVPSRLAVVVTGAVTGSAWMIPVAQIFGLSFAVVFAWSLAFLGLRSLRRAAG